MNWIPAVPSDPSGFTWARKQFSTNNDSASCAGFSQTWLVMSLVQGGLPVTNPGLLQQTGVITNIHRGRGFRRTQNRGGLPPRSLGRPSVQSLPDSGLEIENTVQKPWTGWADIFQTITLQPPGHYYLTMKQPYTHAMACIIVGTTIHYLEPQVGLFLFQKEKFTEGATSFYSKYPWSPANGYKIYKVKQSDRLEEIVQ